MTYPAWVRWWWRDAEHMQVGKSLLRGRGWGFFFFFFKGIKINLANLIKNIFVLFSFVLFGKYAGYSQDWRNIWENILKRPKPGRFQRSVLWVLQLEWISSMWLSLPVQLHSTDLDWKGSFWSTLASMWLEAGRSPWLTGFQDCIQWGKSHCPDRNWGAVPQERRMQTQLQN